MTTRTGLLKPLFGTMVAVIVMSVGLAVVAAPASAADRCTGPTCATSDDGELVAEATSQVGLTATNASGNDATSTGTRYVRSEPVYNPCRWVQSSLTPQEMDGMRTDREFNQLMDRMGEDMTWPADLQQRQTEQGSYYYGRCTSGSWPGETLDQFFAFTNAFFAANPGYRWVPAGTPPPPPPPLPPSVLMVYAREALQVPQPQVSHNPAGNAVVNLPTWFWADQDTFEEISVTATSGPNSATVVARPATMSLSAADATQQGGCATGGVAYDTSKSPSAQSTDCALLFSRSSARQPGNANAVTVSTVWTASWTGSDGSGGTLDGTTQSTSVPVPVTEVQTVVTR